MNIAIGTRRSTWKGLKGRYVLATAGIILAAGIAYAGIDSLVDTDPQRASVGTIAGQSQPLFPTAADAVFAVESGVAVPPQFANMADAVAALPVPTNEVALSQPAPQFTTESRDAYLGLGQPGESIVPQFPTMADAATALLIAGEEWETTLADRPVDIVEKPLTPESEALSAGYPVFP